MDRHSHGFGKRLMETRLDRLGRCPHIRRALGKRLALLLTGFAVAEVAVFWAWPELRLPALIFLVYTGALGLALAKGMCPPRGTCRSRAARSSRSSRSHTAHTVS